jgi:hypothetical protein
MQTSRSHFETSIALGLILFGVLIACSSNNLLATAFGVFLMLVGACLYFGAS